MYTQERCKAICSYLVHMNTQWCHEIITVYAFVRGQQYIKVKNNKSNLNVMRLFFF